MLFSACGTQKDVVQVQNITKIDSYNPTAMIYNLPKTKIYVVVEVEKIIRSKGPYSDFTEKYLGSLNNVVKENNSSFQISNINFYSVPIIDTAQTYVVSSSNFELLYGLNMTRDGFLISLNDNSITIDNQNIDVVRKNNLDNNVENYTFDILTSDKNYKIVYDTVYREEVYDTIIRKIPILKKNVILKTPAEQAKELADQILTLRDDRAALFVGEGDSDYLPEGDALQIMLAGIDKLEKDYLSMFVGKTDTVKYTYTYSYVPNENEFYKKIILFKFSENSGVLPSDNLFGTPVFFEIVADNYSENIKNYQKKQFLFEQMNKVKKSSGLFYRVPERVSIRILHNSHILSYKSIFVSQLGAVESLPSELFNNKNLKIEFYPELGSIKNISNK